MTTTDLAHINTTTGELSTVMPLDQKIEYAKLLADSGLIPKVYQKQPANVLAAMEYGQALGIDPIVALNQITVVNGGVSMEAKLMIGLVRKAGHTLRLEGDDKTATCTIVRADDPSHPQIVVWDEAKAKRAGLWGKNHWLLNPGLMLKYRAASENIRLTCPEVLAGITYTPEELAENRGRNDRGIQVTQLSAATRIGDPAKLMKALKLSSSEFRAFASRSLGTQVGRWTDLCEDDQNTVIAGLNEWLTTGVDPTTELVDGELVEPERVGTDHD